MKTILAVDPDVRIHKQQTAEWAKYGVGTRRAHTVHDAIVLLTGSESYLFIAINEDTMPDFVSRLPLMRDATDFPIFVFTSDYAIDKKLTAMSLGADVYDHFSYYAKDNVLSSLAILQAQRRWAQRPARKLPLIVCGDIILSPSRRKVLVRDTEVTLTTKEFDILRYFMANPDIVLTYRQIYRRIWGCGYDEEEHHLVWYHISLLRQSLEKALGENDYITTVRDIGYRFKAPSTLQSVM